MSTGKVQSIERNSSFALKFIDRIRLTLCLVPDSTTKKIFATPNLSVIIIDLTETQGIDSTTLGLLAKLSTLSRQKIGLLPMLVAVNPGAIRLLQPTGFDQVFNTVDRSIPCPERLFDLLSQDQSEDAARDKVPEAHYILAGPNESNHEAFRDLISTLERHQPVDLSSGSC